MIIHIPLWSIFVVITIVAFLWAFSINDGGYANLGQSFALMAVIIFALAFWIAWGIRCCAKDSKSNTSPRPAQSSARYNCGQHRQVLRLG
jgi:hypothetical protein